MTKAPPPLSDDLEELLDAERDIDAPSSAQRDRMYARIAPLILPVGVGLGTVTPDTVASTAAGIGKKLVLVSLISAAVGAGGGAAGHAYYASKHPTLAASAPVALAAPSVSVVESEIPSPVASVVSVVPAPSASAKLVEPARTASSLRSERLLLETASAALMKGDNPSAIAALKQHAQRFPKGELAQEREVLLVQALAASGDDTAAQRKAKDFKKKFPGSLQQDSVDKASKPK